MTRHVDVRQVGVWAPLGLWVQEGARLPEAAAEYFRTHQPRTLITWGKNDEIFGAPGAEMFARDLPDAEIHLLDAGHFALETHGEEIAGLIRPFLLAGHGRER